MSFNGKAIYNPKGKAGEYSEWACNFYTGCSNNCAYCYCKRGVMSHVWTDKAQLKKCFTSPEHAVRVFVKEMFANIDELREKGIFFTFTSDPMLAETKDLNLVAIQTAIAEGVPVQILTKRADLDDLRRYVESLPISKRGMMAVGFTLTWHDGLEPGASPNEQRVEAMRVFKELGCHTFASIEPIIDLQAANLCILKTRDFCDLYKIGLMSGGKKPERYDLVEFVDKWNRIFDKTGNLVYWKESITSYLGDTVTYPIDCCVAADYNIFKGDNQ